MNSHITQFCQIKLTQPMLAIGLMSGTSVDAIDAALVRFESTEQLSTELIHFDETPISNELRQRVFSAMDPNTASVEQICQLNMELGEAFAKAALHVTQQAKVTMEKVSFIASHGQTIYHIPNHDASRNWMTPSTLQLGAASVIAERTGVTTVSDFRTADMAAGGVGAPLVPFVDAVLFGGAEWDVICQNIGGIANGTLLRRDGEIVAFDSGPGNIVIDRLMKTYTDQPFDANGQRAKSGKVIQPLLDESLMNPYLKRQPPKATGHEDFGADFTQWFVEQSNGAGLNDLLATATEFTAVSITQAYTSFFYSTSQPKSVIVSGGGAKNGYLMERLKHHAPQLRWKTSDEAGVSSDAKEALGFAMLGLATLQNIPSNVPSVTNAKRPVVLGSITPGRGFQLDF